MHRPARSATAIKVLGKVKAEGGGAVGSGAISVAVLEADERGVESWPTASEGIGVGGVTSAADVAVTARVGAWVGGRVRLGSGEATGTGVSVAC
jgi:hypothetical protein